MPCSSTARRPGLVHFLPPPPPACPGPMGELWLLTEGCESSIQVIKCKATVNQQRTDTSGQQRNRKGHSGQAQL